MMLSSSQARRELDQWELEVMLLLLSPSLKLWQLRFAGCGLSPLGDSGELGSSLASPLSACSLPFPTSRLWIKTAEQQGRQRKGEDSVGTSKLAGGGE